MFMRKLVAAVLICLFATLTFAQKRVKKYTKRNGTVVQSHLRTKPNRTKSDNYSTKGNRNPYSGKKGKKRI